MPFVKSLTFKCYACIIKTIVLLGEIMPSYSQYIEKKLLCIVIITPSNYYLVLQ